MNSGLSVLIPLISIAVFLASAVRAQDGSQPDLNARDTGPAYLTSMGRKDTQIYGLNPFGPEALKSLVPGARMPEGIDWAEVDKLIYSRLPSPEDLRKRWLAETGSAAPTGTEKLFKADAEAYIQWAVSQPEVVAAQVAFREYLAENYVFVPGNEGEAPRYRKISGKA